MASVLAEVFSEGRLPEVWDGIQNATECDLIVLVATALIPAVTSYQTPPSTVATFFKGVLAVYAASIVGLIVVAFTTCNVPGALSPPNGAAPEKYELWKTPVAQQLDYALLMLVPSLSYASLGMVSRAPFIGLVNHFRSPFVFVVAALLFMLCKLAFVGLCARKTQTGSATGGTDDATNGGADGGADGAVDGGTDGGVDGGTDGGVDGGMDGGMDGGTDDGMNDGMDGGMNDGMDGGMNDGVQSSM